MKVQVRTRDNFKILCEQLGEMREMIMSSQSSGVLISEVVSNHNVKSCTGLIGKNPFEKMIANGLNGLKTVHLLWRNMRYPTERWIGINNFIELFVHNINERDPPFMKEGVQVELLHCVLMINEIDNLLSKCAPLVTCPSERCLAMRDQQLFAGIC